jgi:hypothetical protein
MKLPAILIVGAVGLLPAVAVAQPHQRISVAPDGSQANGPSHFPALSENGQCVAYESDASNLVTGDTNGVTDIFVFDRQTGVTTRESVGAGGVQANAASHQPSVSADCHLIVFQSDATNLVAGVSGTQIFVRDRRAGVTLAASVSTSGVAASGSSGSTKGAAVTADGRVVSFESDASNLVNGDTNGVPDVFTHDLASGLTVRESVTSNGDQISRGGVNPFLTANGRYMAFASLGSVYVHDRSTGQTTVVFSETRGELGSTSASVRGDGSYVVFVKRSSFSNATYFYDRLRGETTVVNYDSRGHNSFARFTSPRVANDGHIFFQRSLTAGGLHTTTTAINVYAADLTQVKHVVFDIPRDRPDCCDTDADEPPSLAGDTLAYATIASLVSSDTNRDYDVYLDRLEWSGPLSAPVNLAFSLAGSTLTLTWTPPAIGVPTSYVIEAGSSPGTSDFGTVQAGSSNTYVTRITPGGRFFVRVRATNSSEISSPSNEVVVSGAPGTPTDLSSSLNGSTVMLTWNAPQSGEPVSNYVVTISDPLTFSCVGVGQCPAPPVITTITTTTTSLTVNAVPEYTYFVTVSASNSSGSSAASNVAVAFVDRDCTPVGPPFIRASVDGSLVTLTWDAVSGATSYLLQVGSERGRSDLLSSNLGSVTRFVAPGVPPGTYWLRMRSLNSCSISSASFEVGVTVR